MNRLAFTTFLSLFSFSLWATIAGEAEFLDSMSKSNANTIEISQTALQKSESKDVKKIAEKIISRQNKEQSQMKKYKEKWYKDVKVPQNGQTFLNKDQLNNLQGKEFDKVYLDLMTRQHKANIELMGKMMPNIDRRAIHHLAIKMIKKQGEDISRMQKIQKDL